MDSTRRIRITAIDPMRLIPFAVLKGVICAVMLFVLAGVSDQFAAILKQNHIHQGVFVLLPILFAVMAYISAVVYNFSVPWTGGIDFIMEDVEEARRETSRQRLSNVFPEQDYDVKTSWYVVSSAGRRGPYSTGQLSQLIRDGGIDKNMELNRVKVNEQTREQVSTVTQYGREFGELSEFFPN